MSEWGRITAEAIWKVKSLETRDGETTKGWIKAIKKNSVGVLSQFSALIISVGQVTFKM